MSKSHVQSVQGFAVYPTTRHHRLELFHRHHSLRGVFRHVKIGLARPHPYAW
jgi:hypothetical protein